MGFCVVICFKLHKWRYHLNRSHSLSYFIGFLQSSWLDQLPSGLWNSDMMGNSDEVGNGKSEAVTQVGSTGNPRSISIAALNRDPWSKLIQAAALRNSTNQSHWVADRHTSLKWPAQQHTDLSVRVPATDLSRSVDELGVWVWHTRLTERALILHPWLECRDDWNADELNPSRSHIFYIAGHALWSQRNCNAD